MHLLTMFTTSSGGSVSVGTGSGTLHDRFFASALARIACSALQMENLLEG
jgi:hypothetical protein